MNSWIHGGCGILLSNKTSRWRFKFQVHFWESWKSVIPSTCSLPHVFPVFFSKLNNDTLEPSSGPHPSYQPAVWVADLPRNPPSHSSFHQFQWSLASRLASWFPHLVLGLVIFAWIFSKKDVQQSIYQQKYLSFQHFSPLLQGYPTNKTKQNTQKWMVVWDDPFLLGTKGLFSGVNC